MATDKRVKLPSSAGGIMQYYDEYHSKISISPWHVIIMTVGIMLFIALLHIIKPLG